MATDQPHQLGGKGEEAVEGYLRAAGFRILARGWRSRIGELDLVALDRQCVVFVEVKTRTGHEAGHPSEAVTPAKQRKLTSLALQYLKAHGLLNRPARFDVVSVTWPAGEPKPRIEHFRNAFEASGKFQMYA
jgi:putative endonuclease